MFKHLRTAVCATALLTIGSGVASAGTSTAFAIGSLIIPGGSAFQDDCGVVSRFGLIYDVLRANPWLATHGGIIHVDYVVRGGKGSPNRSVPTWTAPTVGDLLLDPTILASAKIAPPTTTGRPKYATTWDDGYDIHLYNLLGKPATLVVNSTNPPSVPSPIYAPGDGNIVTFNTFGKLTVYPQYNGAVTVDATIRQLSYLGAPFVIPAADATQFLNLVNGSVIAQDTNGNNIDFSSFKTIAACGGLTGGYTASSMNHHVNIHRAAVAFNAEVSREFTSTPPRLALLATDYGAVSQKLFDGILEGYLNDAGLNFPGAGGCPTGSVILTKSVCGGQTGAAGTSGATRTCCAGGVASLGQIYDLFDVQDIAADLMSTKVGGNFVYSMVWAPHWESKASSAAPTGTDAAMFTKLNAYLNNQTGFMGECGSVSTLEGAYTSGSPDIYAGLQLQTCKSTTCTAPFPLTTNNFGIIRNTSGTSPSGTRFRNCTDDDWTTGACAYYGVPDDPFVQPGDFSYEMGSGHVTDLIPLGTTGSQYKPGVLPLISIIKTLTKANLASPALARAMVDSDVQTRNQKDDTATKANIVYVGGHDLTTVTSGTQLVLETLLQLGAVAVVTPPPVTLEVTRSNPVIYGANLYQGTFEQVTPAATPKVVTLAADVTTFSFPAVIGHMRARTLASISTTADSFASGTTTFDAAVSIPAVNNSGCATNFTSTCRSVFTTITDPTSGLALRPGLHFFKDGEAANIGPKMVSGMTSTEWTTLVERVLAGYNSSGSYVAKLGGVDHSTVSVIPQSANVAATRPTIVYFGAMDGMLHAVCADATAPCTAIGKELWAFVPRSQLPYIPKNTAKIDGSVRVMDMFGDFKATGVKGFHTLLWFQTSEGDPTSLSKSPSIIEMDVTDPASPTVVWEYTLANLAPRASLDLGNGLTLGAGVVPIAGVNKNLVFAQTNNGGTGSTGVVVDAIDADTGVQLWRFSYAYPALHVGTDIAIPASGLPGGVVPIDKTGLGYVTDIAFGDLYGNFWELDPATGVSRYTTGKPLFQYSADYHPLGVAPTIYSNGSSQFAVLVPGGFTDPIDSTWGSATQQVASVWLNTPNVDATLTEASVAPDVPFKVTLGAGERTFAQALVVGGQLFITTDSTDVNNSATFGNTANTGKVYTYTIASSTTTTQAIAGGAGSVINSGTNVYAGSSSGQQKLGTGAATTTGASVDTNSTAKVSRTLWLRTL